MKTNEIRIEISVAQDELFEFTVEPLNTPKWIEGAGKGTVDTEQIGLGTIYTNSIGQWEVTDYERNVFFELTDKATGYSCSYSYRKIDENTTELVYFESMEDGSDLIAPMEEKHFQKLKELLEK